MTQEDPTTSQSEIHSVSAASTSSFISNYLTTSSTRRTPVRYVLSGIKPSLSYVETVGIILVTLLSPLLTEPIYACKQTHLINHIATHVAGISVAYIVAAFILGVFSELHHYYGDCGGLVSVCKKVSCSPLSTLVLVTAVVCSVLHVAYSLSSLSDTIDRLSEYYISDLLGDWADSRLNIIAMLLIFFIYAASLLGVVFIARVSAFLGLLCFVATFLVGGYGIAHKFSVPIPNTDDRQLLARTNSTDQLLYQRTSRDSYPSNLVDRSIHGYLSYMCQITGQVIVVALLVSLSEDNKLKKWTINAIGAASLGLCMISVLFLNTSVAHITSPFDVFPDQICATIGIPPNMVLMISVISVITVLARGILIMASTCRLMVHVVISKEELGFNSMLCKVLKFPVLINCVQCLLMGIILLLKKQEIFLLALIQMFLYCALGGVCHIMHRYKSADVSETTPLFGNFGSLRALRTIRLLIVVLYISSVGMCAADVLQDHLDISVEMVKRGYVIVRICLALVVIGCISVIASFQQQRDVHKIYRWIIWTPMVPCSLVIMGCAVGTFIWFWASISTAFVILVSGMVLVYDKLFTHCCCVSVADDASQVS